MNIFEFMEGSPYLTFFLALVVYYCVFDGLKLLLIYFIGRPLRAMNIRKHGWPPPHCDADGDLKE